VLTDSRSGQQHAGKAAIAVPLGDPFADFADAPNRSDMREPLHQLHAAVRQIEVGDAATQLEAAANVLVQARRSLYLILAGEAGDVGEGVKAVSSLVLAHASQLADRFSTAQAQSSS
jgi:hypothetical protein